MPVASLTSIPTTGQFIEDIWRPLCHSRRNYRHLPLAFQLGYLEACISSTFWLKRDEKRRDSRGGYIQKIVRYSVFLQASSFWKLRTPQHTFVRRNNEATTACKFRFPVGLHQKQYQILSRKGWPFVIASSPAPDAGCESSCCQQPFHTPVPLRTNSVHPMRSKRCCGHSSVHAKVQRD